MQAIIPAHPYSQRLRKGNRLLLSLAILLAGSSFALAQAPPATEAAPAAQNLSGAGSPIAIVSFNSDHPDQSATVSGALEVTGGRAIIAASGTIAAGTRTADVLLPRRGTLRVCASTSVKLAADSSVPAGETPGLLMAIDHGALEMSFATLQNADILLTPDFRILIGGPGSSDVKVRLGENGDTCVDNSGANAPYVVVSSLFDSGVYRVQPGQRVMFERGKLNDVVDREKEPCGCPPPPAETKGNEFPLAQSEGLAPTAAPAGGKLSSPPADALVYNSAEHAPQPVAVPAQSVTPASAASSGTQTGIAAQKTGILGKIGRFFRRIFGAE